MNRLHELELGFAIIELVTAGACFAFGFLAGRFSRKPSRKETTYDPVGDRL